MSFVSKRRQQHVKKTDNLQHTKQNVDDLVFKNAAQQNLEDESTIYLNIMAENIHAVRNIAANINHHLSNEEGMFLDLNQTSVKASGLFKFTQRKFTMITSSGSERVLYYLILFIIFLFAVLYFNG